jgi:hypothetical protein
MRARQACRLADRERVPRMDEAERLIEGYRARATSPLLSKLDTSADLERLNDPRIVPFLVHVLADQREPPEVRIHVLKRCVLHSRRSSEPVRRRSPSRYSASCRRTTYSVSPPEVSCCHGTSDEWPAAVATS